MWKITIKSNSDDEGDIELNYRDIQEKKAKEDYQELQSKHLRTTGKDVTIENVKRPKNTNNNE